MGGKLIVVSSLQSANISSGSLVMVAGSVTDTNDVNPLNAASPSSVTDDGIMMVCNDVQYWNMLSSIV